MFKTFGNALKVKEIRNGLLFTFFILIVIRIGSVIPVPGLNTDAISFYLESKFGDAGGFMNSITGGSFQQMTIFALSVTPYITSSIIMQLLTIAIPVLEDMQKDGEEGRKKINTITRYVTILLAVIESIGLAVTFDRKGYMTMDGVLGYLMVVVTLTAGSTFVMWLGEKINDYGVGNGISVVLLINIVSRMPADFKNLYDMFMKGEDMVQQIIAAAIIITVITVTVVLVVLLQDAERKIPVQYAQKMQGRRLVGGRSSHIPLKVNTSGVIPIIFASSILSVPAIVVNLFGLKTSGVWSKILTGMNSNYWFNPSYPWASVGVIFYILLVFFFAYFYTSVTFNPMEVANNMKRSGGFIPGIRPGKPTQDYFNKILNYIVFIGATALIIVAIIPIIFNGVFGANVSFGGTSLIIIVGVVIETIKQIESKMIVRNYTGFLND
ncbi:MAG: preprotein translocase subunit SecY [Lachnospiraceae bacterium]|nr:preprotein translocase subunit SecY [Lachnospiraceae bacterium]